MYKYSLFFISKRFKIDKQERSGVCWKWTKSWFTSWFESLPSILQNLQPVLYGSVPVQSRFSVSFFSKHKNNPSLRQLKANVGWPYYHIEPPPSLLKYPLIAGNSKQPQDTDRAPTQTRTKQAWMLQWKAWTLTWGLWLEDSVLGTPTWGLRLLVAEWFMHSHRPFI